MRARRRRGRRSRKRRRSQGPARCTSGSAAPQFDTVQISIIAVADPHPTFNPIPLPAHLAPAHKKKTLNVRRLVPGSRCRCWGSTLGSIQEADCRYRRMKAGKCPLQNSWHKGHQRCLDRSRQAESIGVDWYLQGKNNYFWQRKT